MSLLGGAGLLLRAAGASGDLELMASSFSQLAVIEPDAIGDNRGIAKGRVVPYGGNDNVTDVTSPDGKVVIKANGNSEIDTDDQLWGLILYNYGRDGSSGTSRLGFYSEISFDNGVTWNKTSFPLPGLINNPSDHKLEVLAAPVRKTTPGKIIIRQGLFRSLLGNDSGGLYREDWGEIIDPATWPYNYSPAVEIQWWRAT